MRSLGDVMNSSAMHMPRAKSEFNLTSATVESKQSVLLDFEFPEIYFVMTYRSYLLNRSHFFTVTKYDQRPVVRALYSYLASGENQLTFHEHDRIALVGDRAKGWQFGENLRTQLFGWFPVAYTELEVEESHSNWGATQNGGQALPQLQQQHQQQNGHGLQAQASQQQQMMHQSQSHHHMDHTPESSLDSTLIEEDEDDQSIPSKYQDEHSPTRMFGDTIMYRQSKQYRRVSNHSGHNGLANGGNTPMPGPPPTLPAPIPMMPSAYGQKSHISQSHSFSSNGGAPIIENRKSMPATMNFSKQVCHWPFNSSWIDFNPTEIAAGVGHETKTEERSD